jgi:diguanylate cyclase (GGDEF)-like protein/PAS domain S-box-containing protein
LGVQGTRLGCRQEDVTDSPPSRARRWWLLPSGALLVAVPAMADASAGSIALGAVALAAALVASIAVWRMPASRRTGWPLLVGALWTWTLAELVFRGTTASIPGLVHELELGAIPYSLAVLLLVSALRSTRRTPDRHDVGAWLDAAVIVVVVAVVGALLLLHPAWGPLVDGPLQAALLLLYPASLLLLLATLIRLAFAAYRPGEAERLLMIGGTAVMLSATVTGFELSVGPWLPHGPHVVLSALGYALLAAAALLAQGQEDAVSGSYGQRTEPRRRLLVLAGVVATIPLIQFLLDPSARTVVLALGTAAVLGLVITRVSLLVHELEELHRHDVRDQRERDRRRFEALVQHASDVVLVIDHRGQVSYASPSAQDVLGEPPIGWTYERLGRAIHPDERTATVAALEERLAGSGGRPVRLNARLRDRQDREHHVDIVAVDLRDDPDIAGTVLTLHETTERAELEAKLRHLAFHDPLTGLTNRPLLIDRLSLAQARARRVGAQNAILLCDLDGFKDVNDQLGHAAGDIVLCQVADRIRGVSRATDTVARLGGDEFAIVCEDIGTARSAILAARRTLHALSTPVEVDGQQIEIGVSIGIVVDTGERGAEELLRDADVALYEAKAEGKQRYALHRAAMTLRAQARLQLASDLTRAIADRQIEIEYQPIVQLPTGRIVGVESLARWQHPVRGAIPPSEFIDVAERSGAIVRLGDLVLEGALAATRHWLDDRPELLLRIGVNLSARQLRDPDLVGRIATLLATYEVPPSWLVLELTESTMLDDVDTALSVMHQLKAIGVRFAVDDFGTGYSSLAYLHRLPVDVVKIDRGFTRELGHDAGVDQLVRTVVDLGRNLKLDTLAEGVETAEQRRILEAMGCGFAQGYLFARPLSRDDLGRLLLGRGANVTVQRTLTGDDARHDVPGSRRP